MLLQLCRGSNPKQPTSTLILAVGSNMSVYINVCFLGLGCTLCFEFWRMNCDTVAQVFFLFSVQDWIHLKPGKLYQMHPLKLWQGRRRMLLNVYLYLFYSIFHLCVWRLTSHVLFTDAPSRGWPLSTVLCLVQWQLTCQDKTNSQTAQSHTKVTVTKSCSLGGTMEINVMKPHCTTSSLALMFSSSLFAALVF